jgi:hypothetical protein
LALDAESGAIASRSQAVPSESLQSLDLTFNAKTDAIPTRRSGMPSQLLKSRPLRPESFLIATIAALSIAAVLAFCYYAN